VKWKFSSFYKNSSKTLGLFMEKEPEEISMREIAKMCGVTATTLYYYYNDKDTLFEGVKLECLEKMDSYIAKKTRSIHNPAKAIKATLAVFRDWAFANPRMVLLVMQRFKPNKDADEEELKKYYRSTFFGKSLLDKAAGEGKTRNRDTLMDASLCIAVLWGAVESILLNRTIPKYWDNGILFTNKMIELCCSAIFLEGDKNEK
jgi:AcrR family transcriptional regulator